MYLTPSGVSVIVKTIDHATAMAKPTATMTLPRRAARYQSLISASMSTPSRQS